MELFASNPDSWLIELPVIPEMAKCGRWFVLRESSTFFQHSAQRTSPDFT
jgi:hypothetical protein